MDLQSNERNSKNIVKSESVVLHGAVLLFDGMKGNVEWSDANEF